MDEFTLMGKVQEEALNYRMNARILETLSRQIQKPSSKQNLKILLVEDDADDHLLTSEALEKSFKHFDLDWVQDGAEAREYLNNTYQRDASKLPDLILLDLNMPKVNGHQLLKEIKHNDKFKNIVTVVLTSSKSSNDMELAYETGADSYIVKSLRFSEMVEDLNVLAARILEV